MKFADALNVYPTIVQTGPLGTRLKYDYQYQHDPQFAISDSLGRDYLRLIYQEDIEVAKKYNLPIIVNTPTFRTSKNHLPSDADIKEINFTCLNFVEEIKESYSSTEPPIFIGAPIGSLNDAYTVDSTLTVDVAKQYHQHQINIFKEAQIDFVNVLTISSFNEALGIALAAQQSDIAYTIGFILTENGTLLDGTPLHIAIQKLDEATNKKPLGYLITCTHASVIEKLSESPLRYERLIGIQANGSNFSPQKLAAATTAITDSPEKFAQDIERLKNKLGLIIIAGCCGTTNQHLEAIAKK